VFKRLLLVLVFVSPSLYAQNSPEFPTDSEITTLMQQANLAMKQYQAAMDVEAKIGKDADAKEREKNAAENWQLPQSSRWSRTRERLGRRCSTGPLGWVIKGADEQKNRAAFDDGLLFWTWRCRLSSTDT
jgi:hypothetical protein